MAGLRSSHQQVSVIVPVRDDVRVVRCVRSILAAAADREPVEVIVVDHRSAPSLAAALDDLRDRVTVVRYDGETVYGARNFGIDHCSGEVVMLTDADCVVRPGWLAAAVAAIDAGADLVQGFSASLGVSRTASLIQSRASAPYRRLRRGDPVECDTRNLAVRRAVFDRLRFREEYRRVGDTELGLTAQLLGFRVWYEPAMVVDHEHETDIPLFAAKQVCHGWGAQRLMAECPAIRWNGGHLRLVARFSRWLRRIFVAGIVGRALAWAMLRAAGALQGCHRLLPAVAARLLLGAIDKVALLAGHLLYAAGAPEPSPSALLGRALPRD